jgi:hypothetical protein
MLVNIVSVQKGAILLDDKNLLPGFQNGVENLVR